MTCTILGAGHWRKTARKAVKLMRVLVGDNEYEKDVALVETNSIFVTYGKYMEHVNIPLPGYLLCFSVDTVDKGEAHSVTIIGLTESQVEQIRREGFEKGQVDLTEYWEMTIWNFDPRHSRDMDCVKKIEKRWEEMEKADKADKAKKQSTEKKELNDKKSILDERPKYIWET